MKKRIVSALMAMAMCISALPMSVCAKNDKDIELLEFTQRLRDEYLLDPEESEENRLIYNYAKRLYDSGVEYSESYNRPRNDVFLGVQKDEMGIYRTHCLFSYDDKQMVGMSNDNIAGLAYIDNPYITEEKFKALSYDEKIITTERIYEETGDDIAERYGILLALSPLYIYPDGKCYNWDDEEIDIVDGKIVTVYNNIPDNADVLTTETLKGDANEDGKVSVADAVLIMQALSNPDDYKLTEQGALNADYNGDGGVTTADALEIQMIDIS
ncbi:MAG: dockerin type I repeat-containing protein [Prevotella sp.]|nr:dockerin type I repeat-containing protein [Alistipes senegalensis]MCM1358564.1 dockerin type I repeat-containing protein [Prevotella sp.]MCM1473906.1 dockerin type I repeat-containing protein [Muribaculaceae bacterium]